MGHPTRMPWRGWALPLLATVAVLVPVWAVEYPPLQDYPYHLVRAEILARGDAAGSPYAGTFVTSWLPTPYALADYLVAGLALLAPAVPVELAGRLLLSLILVLFPWSLIALLRAVAPGKEPLGLFGFLLVYSWHFQMGFLGYLLGVALALFTFSWWWWRRRRLAAPGVASLALLALLVYLAHLYAFGILAVAVAVAAWAERLPARQWLRALACFAPPLALLAALWATQPSPAGDQGPLLLLYGGPVRKILLFLGTLPSLWPAWEGVVFGLAALLAVGLLARGLAGRRTRAAAPGGDRDAGGPEPALAAVVLTLALLYLVLPDHAGEAFFIANRVPLFLLLFAVPLMACPATTRGRRILAAALAALVLLHVGGVLVRYRAIDRELRDYAAVLREVPAGARIAFLADWEGMREWRIAPGALFGGYHYLESRRGDIPDLEHFVGFLRTVAYRSRAGRTLSTAAVSGRESLEELLGRRWLVGRWGGVLVMGHEGGLPIAEVAGRYGYRRLFAAGPLALWLKVEPVYLRERAEPYYVTGFPDPEWVVVLEDAEEAPEVGPAFREVAREGDVHLLRRMPHSRR